MKELVVGIGQFAGLQALCRCGVEVARRVLDPPKIRSNI
jgi:hypothetical protein